MKAYIDKRTVIIILTVICAGMAGVLIYALVNINKAAAFLNDIDESAEAAIAEITEPPDVGFEPIIITPEKEEEEEEEAPEDVPAVKTPPQAVKGIYVTANRVGLLEYFTPIVDMLAQTELNAIVLDVKTDTGEVTFTNSIQTADNYGTSADYIRDITYIIDTLNEIDVYKIARIVAFKDNTLCDIRPDLYIKDAEGSLWRDGSAAKSAWLNPYNKDSWEYLIGIAEGAIDAGFDEIQFDYIRFDTSERLKDADFGDTAGKSRVEIIGEFTAYAAERIKAKGALISADVYGTIITSELDAGIVGQDYRLMAKYLDYISPMIYPSHYGNGSFGVSYPDTQPYDIIKTAMEKSNEALKDVEDRAVVRPWLQAFTASWLTNYIPYTSVEVRQQIQAVYDADGSEWLIWNSQSNYDTAYFELSGD